MPFKDRHNVKLMQLSKTVNSSRETNKRKRRRSGKAQERKLRKDNALKLEVNRSSAEEYFRIKAEKEREIAKLQAQNAELEKKLEEPVVIKSVWWELVCKYYRAEFGEDITAAYYKTFRQHGLVFSHYASEEHAARCGNACGKVGDLLD